MAISNCKICGNPKALVEKTGICIDCFGVVTKLEAEFLRKCQELRVSPFVFMNYLVGKWKKDLKDSQKLRGIKI